MLWRPDSRRGERLVYLGSGYLKKVRRADTIWVVMMDAHRLTLIGRLVVDQIVDRQGAARRLRDGPGIDTPLYAFSREPEAYRRIDIHGIARELTFGGTARPLPAGFTGQHLQSMRTLTSGAARLVEAAWERQSPGPAQRDEPIEPDELEFPEGREMYRLHRSHERNARVVQLKKEQALGQHGRLNCEVCGLDFETEYGAVGRGFIECHHIVPVASLGAHSATRLDDLVLVCSNCHRMLHRGAVMRHLQARFGPGGRRKAVQAPRLRPVRR